MSQMIRSNFVIKLISVIGHSAIKENEMESECATEAAICQNDILYTYNFAKLAY